ncbi:MAG: hypothetical protein ACTHJ3_17930 [Pararhizobium sp.]
MAILLASAGPAFAATVPPHPAVPANPAATTPATGSAEPGQADHAPAKKGKSPEAVPDSSNQSSKPQPASKTSKEKTPEKAAPRAAHPVIPPARLIDPDLIATAMEIDQTKTFAGITVESAAKSGNAAPVIAVVSSNAAGQQRLRDSIARKPKLVQALKAHGHGVADVIAVSMDARNDIVLFTRH